MVRFSQQVFPLSAVGLICDVGQAPGATSGIAVPDIQVNFNNIYIYIDINSKGL